MDECSRERFRLDCSDERLWDSGKPVHLTRKAFELLRFLAENPNRLLTKEEIRERLWRGAHVTEALVKEYVHDIRLALGDDPHHPRFIETVRGRGYRLVGELQVSGGCGPELTDPPGGDRPSIAVLPLENLTSEERWSVFCHGIADDLVTDLARLSDLTISTRSRTGLASCTAGSNEIGRMAVARYVLTGSLQKVGNRLRINLHLLRAHDGSALWSERYEFERRNIGSAYQELTARVVSALAAVDGVLFRDEVRRLSRKPIEELTPHELYVLGFHLEEKHEKGSVLRAYDLLRRAVALDPEMPRAWVALGWCCFQISREKWAPNPAAFSKMIRECYLRAWQIDPNDPLAIMNANAKLNQTDPAADCEAYERAAELGWKNADVLAEAAKYIALSVDDPERALQLLSRSIDLKPRCSLAYFMHSARAAYAAGDFEGTLAAARRAPDIELVRVFELLALAQLDRRSELRRQRTKFGRRYPDFNLRAFMRDQPVMRGRSRSLFLEGSEKASLH